MAAARLVGASRLVRRGDERIDDFAGLAYLGRLQCRSDSILIRFRRRIAAARRSAIPDVRLEVALGHAASVRVHVAQPEPRFVLPALSGLVKEA